MLYKIINVCLIVLVTNEFFAQKVKNVACIHNKISDGTFLIDAVTYAESENYKYVIFKVGNDDV